VERVRVDTVFVERRDTVAQPAAPSREPSPERRALFARAVTAAPLAEVPELNPKPTLTVSRFQSCPAAGQSGDPELNRRKNRINQGQYIRVAFDALLDLDWPDAVENTNVAPGRRKSATRSGALPGLPALAVRTETRSLMRSRRTVTSRTVTKRSETFGRSASIRRTQTSHRTGPKLFVLEALRVRLEENDSTEVGGVHVARSSSRSRGAQHRRATNRHVTP
jgi:hypothetical protein